MSYMLVPGQTTIIASSGVAVIAASGPMAGGFITNPDTDIDQGIGVPEPLYVSFVGDAGLVGSGSTIELPPGKTLGFPAGMTNNVSVNAATAGHKFALITIRATPTPPVPPAFTPTGVAFPPAASTMLASVIRSYLYQEYNDDDDLQSFVMAYNAYAQQFIDWFNTINLPVYTQDIISGALLDWVAQGLYGLTRPVLPSGQNQWIGPFNTYLFNQLPFNGLLKIGSEVFYATDDDNFKRMLTWFLFKGDGKLFNVRWLKRRIVRYLSGINGTSPNIDQTYQVSVSFSDDNQVDINIGLGTRRITGGALFNQMLWNGAAFNQMNSVFTPGVPNAEAPILKAAIEAGFLELPFQFDFNINVL